SGRGTGRPRGNRGRGGGGWTETGLPSRRAGGARRARGTELAPEARMQRRSVDAVVIGAGSAGLNAVAELDKAGADWVLVESTAYGTTCARSGCMPSKLLIAAADAAAAMERA